MSEQLGFTKEHEWVSIEDNVATVGITDYAADQLGDVVYVELPEVDATVTAGQVIAEVESTKSVGEIFAPVNGVITEINEVVTENPELVNQDPFGMAWLFKIQFEEAPELLTQEEYDAIIAE